MLAVCYGCKTWVAVESYTKYCGRCGDQLDLEERMDDVQKSGKLLDETRVQLLCNVLAICGAFIFTGIMLLRFAPPNRNDAWVLFWFWIGAFIVGLFTELIRTSIAQSKIRKQYPQIYNNINFDMNPSRRRDIYPLQ